MNRLGRMRQGVAARASHVRGSVGAPGNRAAVEVGKVVGACKADNQQGTGMIGAAATAEQHAWDRGQSAIPKPDAAALESYVCVVLPPGSRLAAAWQPGDQPKW